MLAVAHRLIENHRVTISGPWVTGRGKLRGIGLERRTVGIIGFGGGGTQLAQYLQLLSVTVITSKRVATRAQQHGINGYPLLELARRSDFVVATAALTDQTRGMLAPDFFAAMQRGAYLVNIARGALVDHGELFPAYIRFSGVATSYALGAILGGAFAPTIATALVQAIGTTVSTDDGVRIGD